MAPSQGLPKGSPWEAWGCEYHQFLALFGNFKKTAICQENLFGQMFDLPPPRIMYLFVV